MKRVIFFISIIVFGISNTIVGEEIDFLTQRKNMVEFQIKARGVTDKKVLDAMLKVETITEEVNQTYSRRNWLILE